MSKIKPPKSTPPSCIGCRFWYDKGGGWGNCRRFPPDLNTQKVDERGAILTRGLVASSDWCGEFSPTPSSQSNISISSNG